jgi:hypothetical protein
MNRKKFTRLYKRPNQQIMFSVEDKEDNCKIEEKCATVFTTNPT